MTEEQARRGFEAWALEQGYNINSQLALITNPGGEYLDQSLQNDWPVWQAAIASRNKTEQADGWVSVPIVLTPEMHDAGERFTESYYSGSDDLRNAWSAMLAAAPKAGQAKD